MSWYVARPGAPVGPYTEAGLRAFVREGVLERDALIAQGGDPKWRRIGAVWPEQFSPVGPMRLLGAFVALGVIVAVIAFAFDSERVVAMSQADLTASLIGSVAIGLIATGALWWLLGPHAATSLRWRGAREVGTAIALLLTAFVGLRFVNELRVADLTDKQFAFTLDTKTPGVIRFSGEIGRMFPAALREAIEPSTRLLEIEASNGGLIMPALAAADIIRKHQLRVRVRSRCVSACVALFAAAAQGREVMPMTVLGLHQSVQMFGDASDFKRGEAKYASLLREAGFSESVLAKRVATQPASMLELLPVQDNNELPSFAFVNAQGETIWPGVANLLYAAGTMGKEKGEIAKYMSEMLTLIATKYPVHSPELALDIGRAVRTNDVEKMQQLSAALIESTMLKAITWASPDPVRSYWELERTQSSEAFRRGDYVRCGAPTSDNQDALIGVIKAKLEVIESASTRARSRHPIKPTPSEVNAFTEVFLTAFRAYGLTQKEIDDGSPRFNCASSLAMADVMVGATDEQLTSHSRVIADSADN